MKGFMTLDDVDVKGKAVLVRVDINVPYDESAKTIKDSERVREHARTIKELSDRGAKVIVLAHQGRRGDPDFIHLDQHAKLLAEHIGKRVEFVDDVIGRKAEDRIMALKPGDILLLDNVRMLEDETEEKTPEQHADSSIVRALSGLVDIFVGDAFSAAHRSHASIVGFTTMMPSYAGRVMEREVVSSEKALNPERPNVFVLGGGKPDDCLKILKYMLEKGKLDHALTCGTVGELFLMAKGHDLGKPTLEFFEKKGFTKLVPDAKGLLEKHGSKIEFPVDVAVKDGNKRREIPVGNLPADSMIMDIGAKTAEKYASMLDGVKTVVVKGPAGVCEQDGFELGTRMILEAIIRSKAFSLVGGGDTSVAMERLGIDTKKFSYVSIAGGALITALSGNPMPGVGALKSSSKRKY